MNREPRRGAAAAITEVVLVLIDREPLSFAQFVRSVDWADQSARRQRRRACRSWSSESWVALSKIAQVHPQLAHHFRDTVHLGTQCAYAPKSPVALTVALHEARTPASEMPSISLRRA